jgi:hypothetical protein
MIKPTLFQQKRLASNAGASVLYGPIGFCHGNDFYGLGYFYTRIHEQILGYRVGYLYARWREYHAGDCMVDAWQV